MKILLWMGFWSEVWSYYPSFLIFPNLKIDTNSKNCRTEWLRTRRRLFDLSPHALISADTKHVVSTLEYCACWCAPACSVWNSILLCAVQDTFRDQFCVIEFARKTPVPIEAFGNVDKSTNIQSYTLECCQQMTRTSNLRIFGHVRLFAKPTCHATFGTQKFFSRDGLLEISSGLRT